MKASKLLLILTVSMMASVVMSGCSIIGKRVNAYERANLSKQGMSLVQNSKESAAMNHMFNAREGSTGGFGGAGGGCGCN